MPFGESTLTWDRGLVCTVSGVRVTDLRMEFSVRKSMENNNNTAVVKIFNLKEANRKKIAHEADILSLYGGYHQGKHGTLFTGDVQTVVTSVVTPNIVTEVTAKVADIAHNFGFVNTVLDADRTAPFDIIRVIHKSMTGVSFGATVGVEGLPKKKRPMVVCGGVSAELNKVCRDNQLHWSVQNGELEVVAFDEALPVAVVVSKDTGMIGSPEPTELGVNVKTLLDYSIAPNKLIDVRSRVISGLFRVSEVVYSGNNMDGEYVCSIKGTRFVGTTVAKKPLYKGDIQ